MARFRAATACFLIASTATAGCAARRPLPADQSLVAIGRTAYVDGPRVTPVAIVQDSRCPNGVQCVWPGTVIVTVDIALGSKSVRRDLELGHAIDVADGMLALIRVAPDRIKDQEIRTGDYRFGFQFAGGL